MGDNHCFGILVQLQFEQVVRTSSPVVRVALAQHETFAAACHDPIEQGRQFGVICDPELFYQADP